MRKPRRFSTEAVFEIPGASDRAARRLADETADDQAREQTCKGLVVVAEDDTSMRELVAASLRRDGYEVVEATDGADLLEQLGSMWLDQQMPDLIVTDVRMPRCSGLDFLAGLREPEFKIPVIVITAFGDRALHKEALELGAVAVLDKPFRISLLRSVIAETLKGVKP